MTHCYRGSTRLQTENALKSMIDLCIFIFRTDAGVHALNMPIALDLQKSLDGSVYFNPRAITNRLNIALSYKNIDLR